MTLRENGNLHKCSQGVLKRPPKNHDVGVGNTQRREDSSVTTNQQR